MAGETFAQLQARIGAGRNSAQVSQPGFNAEDDPGWLVGFLGSAASSLPEFIGAEPTETAAVFRAQNPVAGFASAVAPLLIPYGGAYRLSQIPSMSARLERTVAAVVNPVTAPIRAGAVREMVRYAPLEASRLAIGGLAYPDNFGNLFADVAFSEALMGGFGAVGGFFRAGGRAAREPRPDVYTASEGMYAAPTVQLRELRRGAELVNPAYGRAQAETYLIGEALSEVPAIGAVSKQTKAPRRMPAVASLDNARGPQDTAEINSLFSLSAAQGQTSVGIRRQLLAEGDEAVATTLNSGEAAVVAQEAGFADIAQLAENSFFPRLNSIIDNRGAGIMARTLENPTMSKVADNLWLGREAGDGLHVGILRLPSPKSQRNPLIITADPENNKIFQQYVLQHTQNEITLNAQLSITRGKHGKIDIDGASANTVGLVSMRALARELSNAFPELQTLSGVRVSGSRGASREFAGRNASGGVVSDEAVVDVNRLRRKQAHGKGPYGIKAGDRFLVFKTDQPGAFAPKLAGLKDINYSAWARWRQAFQEPMYGNDVFSEADNTVMRFLNPQDFSDVKRFSKQSMVAKLSTRITQSLSKEANLTDSAVGRTMAEELYSIIAPDMFKQGRSGLYGRFSALLSNRMKLADKIADGLAFGRRMYPAGALRGIRRPQYEPTSPHGTYSAHVMGLTDDGYETFIKLTNTNTPADDFAKVTTKIIPQSDIEHIRALQSMNQELMHIAGPALEASGSHAQFKMLEGYIAPTIRLGDHYQIVRNEAGGAVQLVSGKNVPHVNRQANVIVAEAQKAGLTWRADKSELFHATEYTPQEIEKLFADTMQRIGTDEASDAIVRRAMRRLEYTQKGGRRDPSVGGTGAPGMFQERTGLSVSVELPTRKDAIKAMHAHDQRLLRYAATQGYMERFGNEIDRFKKYDPVMGRDLLTKRNQYLGIEGQFTNTLNKILQPVLGPVLGSKPATKIASATNELMYKFNLAFLNPTFALINSLTPLLTAVPQVAFILRASPEARTRMYDMLPAYGADGLPVGVMSHLSPLKVLWQGVRDLKSTEPELRQLWEHLASRGTLHNAQLDEFIGANGTGPAGLRETFKRDGYVQGFRQATTYMADKSEEFSRVLSANMGYRLGQAMGLKNDALFAFSERFVQTTNYMYGVVDRPRMFTGPLGSTFGLFKNWQMHYLGMMANYAGLAWREGVYSPLLWQAGVATAIGGVGATPLRHIADGISNWFTGDPHAYRQMLQNWPDEANAIWFGLPSFLGISLQRSAAIPGTDVRNEIQSLSSVVIIERAKLLGKAVGSSIVSWQATGENPLGDPNIRDQFIAATMPRAISRIASTVEGEYVRSMTTGYPQVREVSGAARLFHALGMNQVEIERQQIAARELWQDQEHRRAMTSGIGAAYAQAVLRGDREEMQSLIRRAVALGLDLSRVMRSAQNFGRREESADSLSRFDRVEAGKWRAALEAQGR